MKLGLLGVNPVSHLILEILQGDPSLQKVYLFDDDPKKKNSRVFTHTVCGALNEVEDYWENNRIDAVLICLGEKNLLKRKELYDTLSAIGINFPVCSDRSAVISPNAKIEAGNIIGPGTIFGHKSLLGANSIVWSGAVIEHNSVIGPHSYLGPNVSLSGFSSIGECSLIGTGATILPEVSVGSGCIVGAGSVVTRAVPDGKTVAGNPAKVIR